MGALKEIGSGPGPMETVHGKKWHNKKPTAALGRAKNPMTRSAPQITGAWLNPVRAICRGVSLASLFYMSHYVFTSSVRLCWEIKVQISTRQYISSYTHIIYAVRDLKLAKVFDTLRLATAQIEDPLREQKFTNTRRKVYVFLEWWRNFEAAKRRSLETLGWLILAWCLMHLACWQLPNECPVFLFLGLSREHHNKPQKYQRPFSHYTQLSSLNLSKNSSVSLARIG